jgi:hypothetical protein
MIGFEWGELATGEIPESDPSPHAASNMAKQASDRTNLRFRELEQR